MTTNNVFAWSGIAGSNADVAGNGITGSSNISLGNDVFQNIMAQITNGMITRGSDIATASTVDFTAATTPSLLHDLTGTTTVTAVTMTAGWWRLCRAQGAFQLTASSTLVVNGSTSTNYTTTAGDLLIFFGYSASTVRVWSIGRFNGGTITNDLTISEASPNILLNASAGANYRIIFGRTSGSNRWAIFPGDSTTESGANAGSDFGLNSYDDTGTYLSTPIFVTRSTGITRLNGLYTPGVTGGSKGADTINASNYYTNGLKTNPGLVLLTSGTVSSAATLDIVLSSYTAYRGILIALDNIIPVTNSVDLLMRVSANGGVSYDSGASNYAWNIVNGSSTTTSIFGQASAGDTSMKLMNSLSNGATGGNTLSVNLMDQNNSSVVPKIYMNGVLASSSATGVYLSTGIRLTAQVTTAVRFLMSSGNISSGSYAVYGYI